MTPSIRCRLGSQSLQVCRKIGTGAFVARKLLGQAFDLGGQFSACCRLRPFTLSPGVQRGRQVTVLSLQKATLDGDIAQFGFGRKPRSVFLVKTRCDLSLALDHPIDDAPGPLAPYNLTRPFTLYRLLDSLALHLNRRTDGRKQYRLLVKLGAQRIKRSVIARVLAVHGPAFQNRPGRFCRRREV